MKKYLVILLSISTLISCEPKDFPNEGIDLPPMEFAFKVYPDTSHIKVGDTLTIHASLSSTLNNNVHLTDGEGEVRTYISRGENIPVVDPNDIYTASNNEDYYLIVDGGGVKWGTSKIDEIRSFTSAPVGDSIIMRYKFVFLKKGLYRLGSFQSSFYKGSKGKTRWNAYFDVDNPHWDVLWNVTGNPAPNPNENHYKRNYLIGVTE